MIMGINSAQVTSNISANGKSCTISVSGNFDFNLVKVFRAAYSGLDPVPDKIMIDLRYAQTIDSAALGMLINMKKYLDKADGAIEIQNCNSTIKRIMSIARFDILFSID